MGTITLYGQPTCTGCNDVKSFLKARDMDYTYVDITSPEGWDAFSTDFPDGMSVPRAVIKKDNVEHRLVGATDIIKTILGA